MTVLRFRMSGREFAFDGARDWTAAELWALDEIGIPYDDLLAVLNGKPGKVDTERALRSMCALAYVSALREDPSTSWADLSRSLMPATFEVVGVDQPQVAQPVSDEVAKRAEQLAAAPAPSLVDFAAQFNDFVAARATGAAAS